ncbi:MAG: cyclic nucleotide-binding domain-containing protein [Aphanocapsa sp. GSE-SYN-MK-11-07L]|nr:cyclic nucleotide-binding domain-containing protein [Aphanocapsa sp. GSE-SYN-MK-11-07L]
MHGVRWLLTIGWLSIIASLFYDPWTSQFTEPDHAWSPLRLPNTCVQVQGICLSEQPYPLGTTLFWGAIVPSSIFILLVFGHEVWRRICPLSFLSQIPRALGWQRQFKRENAKTGKVRYELAKVSPESWLGRNYPQIQFGWLFAGLCGRILFFNADRLVLAGWLLFTIAAAIGVGYFYGGKSWCNYFCPMAPVQKIYSEPGGLFGSKAHTSDQIITQSMCRTVLPDRKEQSACVACQNPCIDIDSERAYWDGLTQPQESWLRYGYVGLVVGYFVYYYLYAGNWSYYFSGAWVRDPDQLAMLFSPGFYLFGQAINIPKLVAVPLTLGGFTAIAHWLGCWLEKRIKAYSRQQHLNLSPELIRHRIFTLCTFGIFNFFFIFGGRPLIQLLPLWVQYLYELGLVLFSTLWAYKTWHRSPDLYSRESLASRFRKQLEKLQLDVSQFLEGRSLSDLNTHEVYILAKVLPGFTKEKRHQAYKGVVREALEEGYVNTSSSLEVLQQLRQELGVSDDEHREVLEELGIEDPELLNPDRQRNLENQIRLNGYKKSLERLMMLQQRGIDSSSFSNLLQEDAAEIRRLRQQYSVTPQEEAGILAGLTPAASNVRKAEFLLAQLPALIASYRSLHQPILQVHSLVLMVLKTSIHRKQALIVQTILTSLEGLPQESSLALAQALGRLAPIALAEFIETEDWPDRLPAQVWQALSQPDAQSNACSLVQSPEQMIADLQGLLLEQNPLLPAVCLYLIAQIDLEQGKAIARDYCSQDHPPLLQETANLLLSQAAPIALTAFPRLEKLVYLFNSDFFHQVHNQTLIMLADRAEIKTYTANAVITEAGDTCRELLLLIEGDAKIYRYSGPDQVQIDQLHPGQTLDELEVLTHSESKNTIIATSQNTRILAIPIDTFDDLLDLDHDFARRVLELESRQLQRFLQAGSAAKL